MPYWQWIEEVPGRVWDAHKLVARLILSGEIFGIYDGMECAASRKSADIAAVSLIEASEVNGDVYGIYEGPADEAGNTPG